MSRKRGKKQGPRSGGLQNSGGECRFKRHLGDKLVKIITDIKDVGLQMSRRQLEKRAESAEDGPGETLQGWELVDIAKKISQILYL